MQKCTRCERARTRILQKNARVANARVQGIVNVDTINKFFSAKLQTSHNEEAAPRTTRLRHIIFEHIIKPEHPAKHRCVILTPGYVKKQRNECDDIIADRSLYSISPKNAPQDATVQQKIEQNNCHQTHAGSRYVFKFLQISPEAEPCHFYPKPE